MEIIHFKHHDEIKQEKETVLVLGYFDGLHLGHKALFDQAKAIASEKDLEVVVLTFKESPQLVFSRYEPDLLLHIAYPEKRFEKFAEFGVDRLYLTEFTADFSKIGSDDFIKKFIERLKADTIVVGFDYKFGHNRTNGEYLSQNFSGDVIRVPEQQESGKKISSTRIRQLIREGKVDRANRLLGYAFSTRGIVVHGDARGRTIGFPTANMAPLDRTFLPSDGVYATEVLIKGKRYRSMTSIGKNMTFDGQELRLETNIFDFEGDIYGETIEVFWYEKIREMVKFESIDALVSQLKADKLFAKNMKKI